MPESRAASPAPALPTKRLGRAALLVFSTSVATSATACGDGGGAVMTTQPSSMAGSSSLGGSSSMNGTSMGGDGMDGVGGGEMGMEAMGMAGMSPGDDMQVQPVYGVAIQPPVDGNAGGASGTVTGDGRPRPGVGGAGVDEPPSAVALYGVAPVGPIDGTGGASGSGDPDVSGGAGGEDAVGGASAIDPGGGAIQPLYGVATLPEEE